MLLGLWRVDDCAWRPRTRPCRAARALSEESAYVEGGSFGHGAKRLPCVRTCMGSAKPTRVPCKRAQQSGGAKPRRGAPGARRRSGGRASVRSVPGQAAEERSDNILSDHAARPTQTRRRPDRPLQCPLLSAPPTVFASDQPPPLASARRSRLVQSGKSREIRHNKSGDSKSGDMAPG
jgi:hypothetical protein